MKLCERGCERIWKREQRGDNEKDTILVNVVPLLDADLLGTGTSLSSYDLLQVPDGIIFSVAVKEI